MVTQNNCSDTSDCVVLNVLNIDDYLNPDQISLYPNPYIDIVHIKGLNQLKFIDKIELTDYNGRLIKTIIEITNKIDVRFLSGGVYFINIKHINGNEVLKLTIQ